MIAGPGTALLSAAAVAVGSAQDLRVAVEDAEHVGLPVDQRRALVGHGQDEDARVLVVGAGDSGSTSVAAARGHSGARVRVHAAQIGAVPSCSAANGTRCSSRCGTMVRSAPGSASSSSEIGRSSSACRSVRIARVVRSSASQVAGGELVADREAVPLRGQLPHQPVAPRDGALEPVGGHLAGGPHHERDHVGLDDVEADGRADQRLLVAARCRSRPCAEPPTATACSLRPPRRPSSARASSRSRSRSAARSTEERAVYVACRSRMTRSASGPGTVGPQAPSTRGAEATSRRICDLAASLTDERGGRVARPAALHQQVDEKVVSGRRVVRGRQPEQRVHQRPATEVHVVHTATQGR